MSGEREFRDALTDIASHLRVALSQSLPTDDQVIIGHVKDSLSRAQSALKEIA